MELQKGDRVRSPRHNADGIVVAVGKTGWVDVRFGSLGKVPFRYGKNAIERGTLELIETPS